MLYKLACAAMIIASASAVPPSLDARLAIQLWDFNVLSSDELIAERNFDRCARNKIAHACGAAP